MDKNSDQNIMDKSMRSVFVGNIPYEATEEKLKDIFSEVGPVLSLKLVFDRESGKPKGYGFCEYKDQETALSAMRNLNGYEIGGRTLRVDNACTEKSRMEMQQLLQGPQVENPYGDPVPPEKAPEVISKVVACLPPERLLQIMKEMKECIEQNPQEARNMLLKNPQISYALLQAQVVMKVIDPKDALKFLHNPNTVPPVLDKSSIPSTSSIPTPSVAGPTPLMSVPIPSLFTSAHNVQPAMTNNFPMNQDIDMRGPAENRPLDPRLSRNNEPVARNVIPPLIKPQHNPQPVTPMSSIYPPAAVPMDPRRPADPRVNDSRGSNPDPRTAVRGAMANPVPMPVAAPRDGNSPLNLGAARSLMGSLSPGGLPSGASDQEKAALIMQVLQLSEEQIAMLPPEQRTSILVLKEQIAKSTGR